MNAEIASLRVPEREAKLYHDLMQAKRKAREAIAGMADEGTCNMDSVVLCTGKDFTIVRMAKWVECAVLKAGFNPWTSKYGWHRGFIFGPGMGGQGCTRTLACEVIAAHLEECGWDATVRYYMD